MKGIAWGKPYPKNFLRLQFSECQEVFPPLLRPLQREIANVNLYPDIAKIEEVRALIGKRSGLSAKNVFLGSGVDSLIDLVARVFCEKGDEVLVPTPTYPCYQDAVRFMGATVTQQKLREDFSLDMEAFLRRITPATKLIYLANPNNPTGNILLSIAQIESLLKAFSGILVVDEEYYDFSGVTALPLLKRFDNLIVLRGFSKSYGIAGLRLGVAFGSEDVVRLFEVSQGATQVFELNRLALVAAEVIVSERKRARQFIDKFAARKRDFELELAAIPGVRVLQTCTSFTMFSTPIAAQKLRDQMLRRKIAMKSMSIYEGVPRNVMITAVPLRSQFDRVTSALSSLLS